MHSIIINNQFYNQIPSSIEEVSIARYIKLYNTDPHNIQEVICWAVDCDIEFQCNTDVEKEYGVILKLADPVLKQIQAFMDSEEKNFMPETLDLLGHKVKITTEFLNATPNWSLLFSRRIMSVESGNDVLDPTDRIPEVLAHYLYSEITQMPYDEAKANMLIYAISQVQMKPGIQFGSFFWRKMISLYYNAYN
jgi:hypothetical protein